MQLYIVNDYVQKKKYPQYFLSNTAARQNPLSISGAYRSSSRHAHKPKYLGMRHQLAALANTWTSLNTSSVASLLHLAATLSSRDQLLCPGMEIRLEVAPVQDTLFPWQSVVERVVGPERRGWKWTGLADYGSCNGLSIKSKWCRSVCCLSLSPVFAYRK